MTGKLDVVHPVQKSPNPLKQTGIFLLGANLDIFKKYVHPYFYLSELHGLLNANYSNVTHVFSLNILIQTYNQIYYSFLI